MYESWDIHYFITTSGHRPPSLISHSPRQTAVFRSVQSCCLHRKHRYSHWNFVAIWHTSWDIWYFMSTSGHRPPSLISYSPPTNGSVLIKPVMLLDIENIGIAVVISLLLCIYKPKRTLCHIHAFPVTGRHLWYITHPWRREVFALALPCFWTSKMAVSPESSQSDLIILWTPLIYGHSNIYFAFCRPNKF